jgi:hypothetical protein
VNELIRIEDYARPRLPLAVRAFNRVGGGAARRFVSLDEESLLETARRRARFDDFGPDTFREPLSVLCRAVREEARISALGRMMTRELLLQLLVTRLRAESLLRRHPEILDERITAPIFILGLPRTGTTHLHNILAADPSLRSLPYWESLEPIPDPESSAGGADPRRARCERALRFQEWLMPHFKAMHEMAVDARHEEIQLLAAEFSTMLFESIYFIPSYGEWYKRHDQTPAYRYLERLLKILQWLRGPRRWVLKSPQHLEQLETLLRVFPDARIVRTHRDPVRVTASLCTMIAYGLRMQNEAIDPHEVGRYWSARVTDLLRCAVVSEKTQEGKSPILDVRFDEFMADPRATVRRVLEFAQHRPDPGGWSAMNAYIEANPRGKHGAVAYELADFGLDRRDVECRVSEYRGRFSIPTDV